MLKTVGILLLILACGMAGIMKAAELKRRIVLLAEMQDLVTSIKSQMSYLREPLCIMFSKLSKNTDSAAFKLPGMCLSELQEKNAEIAEIWPLKVNEIYRNSPLTEDDIQIICQIGSFLGQSDFSDQQTHFQYTEDRLRRQISQAEEIYEKKGGMYRRIGFFGGAAAALVLL